MAIKSLEALKFLVRKPVTVRVPYEEKIPSDRYRGLHANDWNLCIGCGNCAAICTCDAIEMVEIKTLKDEPGKRNLRPRIDYGRCSFCGQCVDICPTGSLKLTADYKLITTDKDDFVRLPIQQMDTTPGKGWISDTEVSYLNYDRMEIKERKPEERAKDFGWILERRFTPDEAYIEAFRCLGCELCIDGCPTRMKIPTWIKHIREGDNEKAVQVMFLDNPFSQVCGTVCTHRCEDACVYSHRGSAVRIMHLKGYGTSMVEDYRKALGTKTKKSTGKKVAIIGAGPGGLTAAYYLRKEGHRVDVYEGLDVAGGMMKVGIPRYRLPQEILDKEIGYIKSLGVKIIFGKYLGKDIKLSSLLKKYHAVLLAIGLHKGTNMGVDGEDLENVLDAVELLRKVNLGASFDLKGRVMVVGGGNTAMDASRTALRLGADEVIISYRRRKVDMPADEDEIKEAEDEGVMIWPQTLPIKIRRKGDKLEVEYVETDMVPVEGERRPRPVPNMKKRHRIMVDYVIKAIGQTVDWSILEEDIRERLKFDRHRLHVNKSFMTSIDGLFAAGDIANRTGDIVSAVRDGKVAAKGIIRYLKKK